jgi:hypothetical protein
LEVRHVTTLLSHQQTWWCNAIFVLAFASTKLLLSFKPMAPSAPTVFSSPTTNATPACIQSEMTSPALPVMQASSPRLLVFPFVKTAPQAPSQAPVLHLAPVVVQERSALMGQPSAATAPRGITTLLRDKDNV